MKDGRKKERREGKEGRRKTCRREEDGWKEGEGERREGDKQNFVRSRRRNWSCWETFGDANRPCSTRRLVWR